VRFGASLPRVSGFERVKELQLDHESCEVLSAEGSCEHVAHPLGGTTWWTGVANIERIEKVEVGERWSMLVTLEGVNPLLTSHVLGIRKGGARGLSIPTREVASCE
jgi:hypothetical protein